MKFDPILVDPDLMDIIDPFVENTVADYKLMAIHVGQNDFAQVRRVCHRILGTAISYGFTEMDLIVKEIQAAAVSEDASKMLEHFKIFEAHIEFIKNQFQVKS